MLVHIDPDTDGAELALGVAALEALTDCHLVTVRRETLMAAPDPGLGEASAYGTRRDIASLFLEAEGAPRLVPVTVPGPKSGIWLADTQTIDRDNAAVIDAVDWLTAYAQDATGTPLVRLTKGFRDFIDKTW